MVDTAVAVGANFGAVRLRAVAGHQVVVHRLRGIVVATGLLHPGTAAEIELCRGERRRAAGGRGEVKYRHIGTRIVGGDGSTGTGTTIAYHHHIKLVVPVTNLAGIEAGVGGSGHAKTLLWYRNGQCNSCLSYPIALCGTAHKRTM